MTHMLPHLRTVLCVGLAALAIGSCSSTSGQSSSTLAGPGGPLAGSSIPLSVVPISGGQADRAMVQVSIAGGPTIPIMLDTGSQGLRVFADAVGTQGLVTTTTAVSEMFVSGVQLTGVLANAPLVVGGLPSAGAIPIMVIQNSACAPNQSQCNPAGATEQATRANNFGAQGIMGVSRLYGQNGIYSPLLQLQGGTPTSYSIHLNGNSGEIRFGQPPANPKATWNAPPDGQPQQSNGTKAWNDEMVPACWQLNQASASCGPSSFDTGNEGMNISPDFPGAPPSPGGHTPVPSGLKVGLSATAGGAPFATMTSGQSPDNLVFSYPSPIAGHINSGINWFRLVTVSYDVQGGQVSVS